MSIDICCLRPSSAANQPLVAAAVDRRDIRTDGRTLDCYIDLAPHNNNNNNNTHPMAERQVTVLGRNCHLPLS